MLESIFGASVGKLAFRMRVIMTDGSRPTGLAIVVRNLIRLPEAWLLYIPSGISCLASSRRQRLGDHAARTVVVRRRASVGAAGFGLPQAPPASGAAQTPSASGQSVPPAPPAFGQPAPPSPAPHGGWSASPAPLAAAGVPSLGDALVKLKTAALAAHGAHLNYLRFSERELAAGTDAARGYSEEYVSAWFTLAAAVASLREARAAAATAADAAGQSLDQACAAQPDLAHLLGELTPYAVAASDQEIHAAFLTVARAEAPAS